MKLHPWTGQDLRRMKSLGIKPAEAERQLNLFRNPPPFLELDRPAALGDGIFKLNRKQKQESLKQYEKARGQGRFLKFVPASGAASRMFHLLLKFFERAPFTTEDLRAEALRGDEESRQFLHFMESLSRTAFFDELKGVLDSSHENLETLRREGRYREILKALLLPDGLNYSEKPKGLIPFHAYGSGNRTPLEEHLVEAVRYVKDKKKKCRIHFTVSQEHEEACRGHFMAVRAKYEKKYGVDFDIRFSTQSSRTNALAADKNNQPFRDEEGRLVFRPSGHGALLENLRLLKGDLVFIKNIDNVVLEKDLETTVLWKKILGGYLVSLQDRIFKHLKELNVKKNGPQALRAATQFAREELYLLFPEEFESMPPASRKKALIGALNRPLRVCGLVPNRGEPGGGPFWVKSPKGGASLQIVERAQVNPEDADQMEIFKKSTHFNPVDLVCGLRDWKGKPFDLRRFQDPNAVFISTKTMGGRELKALELPGLWNGAMAHWITLFVEVPLETFNPVKTVFDLLKPSHQLKV
jgi:hypothetical protein